MRRARRSTGVYEVAKKCAVVRAEAAMDSPVRCELGRGAAVMMSKRVTVMTADGKSVDRCLLTRPVEGWTSFKCLAASAQRPPPDPKAYRDQKIDAILASEADGAPSEPRVAAPAGAARGAAVVLGFWGSSHELVADHTALWVGRGFRTWTHVPSPGEDAAAARGALAAFLEAAPADRLVVHCLSNNGFSWLNAFCEDRGDLLATAAFVFDSAPHVPNCVEFKSSTRLQCAHATVSTQALRPCFENSTRAIDSSKNQPNRLRFDRAREFSSLVRTTQTSG